MITTLNIVPNYYEGHVFIWETAPGTPDPLPWTFQVEISDDGQSRWSDFSPVLTDMMLYHHPGRISKNDKDLWPFYRVRMTTVKGTSYSPVHGIYSDIPKDEYLIAREIMRKELLQMRKMGGVPARLWKKLRTGIPCPVCLDLVTGQVLRSNCPTCNGSKVIDGFSGPYDLWATFSLRQQFKKLDGANTEMYGTTDQQVYEIKMIGHPFIATNDIVIDVASDRRHQVTRINDLFEMRRVPIVVNVMAVELNTKDAAYKLGSSSSTTDPDCGRGPR
jgi:hypothetical protein